MFGIKKKINMLQKQRRIESRIHRKQEWEEDLNVKGITSFREKKLTSDEQKEVKAMWCGVKPRISMKEYGIFKSVNGFDARYLSHHTYLPLIARRINNFHYTKFLEHKSLLGYLRSSLIRFPKCFVRCIDGELYTDDMQQVGEEEAVALCCKEDCLIAKSSVLNDGGKGVTKVELTGLEAVERDSGIRNALESSPRDYVIQECLKQHASTTCFNSLLVNMFRIATLYLNGRLSVLAITFRMVKVGMKVDNLGAESIFAGVGTDGKMAAPCYDINLIPFESQNGVTLKNAVPPQIPAALEHLKGNNKHSFSLRKLIGRGMAFDVDNEPILMEINNSQPRIINSYRSHFRRLHTGGYRLMPRQNVWLLTERFA